MLAVRPALVRPPVLGDRGLLERAVMKLCLNADGAMPDGGRLLITTTAPRGLGVPATAVELLGTARALLDRAP